MDSLAAQAGLVLRNAGLQEKLRRLLEDLRASRQRLVSAQEQERSRLERDLHDGAQQHLVSLRMKLGLAEDVAARCPEALPPFLKELQAEAGEALESLRTLSRGVYPPLLESEGLGAGLAARSPVAAQDRGALRLRPLSKGSGGSRLFLLLGSNPECGEARLRESRLGARLVRGWKAAFHGAGRWARLPAPGSRDRRSAEHARSPGGARW